jgi:phosphoribosylformimino-5-aminoimidazole carboxamide ribotide isomerase
MKRNSIMNIQIIPAIDLMEGQCVRLTQGKRDSRVVYSDNPVQVALKWQEMGAQRLHIVDLDGAFSGKPQNTDVIRNIRNAVSMEIELGGGIRTPEDILNYLDMEIDYVILGTRAFEDREWLKDQVDRHSERIIVGLDAKGGMVASHGWTVTETIPATDFAHELKTIGVCSIIYTDIARDGMLTGPNTASLSQLAETVDIDIFASGGIHTIEDVKKIIELKKSNITGIITGKALYEKTLDLGEAIELANRQ